MNMLTSDESPSIDGLIFNMYDQQLILDASGFKEILAMIEEAENKKKG